MNTPALTQRMGSGQLPHIPPSAIMPECIRAKIVDMPQRHLFAHLQMGGGPEPKKIYLLSGFVPKEPTQQNNFVRYQMTPEAFADYDDLYHVLDQKQAVQFGAALLQDLQYRREEMVKDGAKLEQIADSLGVPKGFGRFFDISYEAKILNYYRSIYQKFFNA